MMNTAFKLKEIDIDKKTGSSLYSIGFKKKRKGLYTKRIADEIDIVVIIEKTDRRTGDTFYLNPIIGIVDNLVEKIYQDLVPDTSQEITNTASISLGYLTPESKYLTWTIPVHFNEVQTLEVVNNLVLSIKAHALPFMETLKERSVLLKALQNNKLGTEKQNYFKIPILYYLEGLKHNGLEYAKGILEKEKPTPKNERYIEPVFSTYKEALEYFRQDKDVRFYYSYCEFINSYKEI